MKKKSLATSTMLKQAQAQIGELEKKLKNETSAKDTFYKSMNEANAVIEQIHQLIDALPNSIGRQSAGEESWKRIQLAPMTRLAAWLAVR